jgi:hypothetical protein
MPWASRTFSTEGPPARAPFLRAALDAIFYLLRTGCQWRLLPRDFPAWGTVYHYFRTWKHTGVWNCVQASHLRADASASGPVCVSIGRYHGRPISEDNRAWRSSWLRCAQTGERPQTSHPRRYLGPADREPSGAGQHIGPACGCSARGHSGQTCPQPVPGCLRYNGSAHAHALVRQQKALSFV